MKYFSLTLLFAILNVLILTEVVLYSRNTFQVHPQWISSKRHLSNHIMGKMESLYTRNLTRRNRLNLAEWHGFNEILFKDIIHMGSIECRFFLEKNSYLCIIFNKTEKEFSGIRISNMEEKPSIFFTAKTHGSFLSKEVISHKCIDDNRWHLLSLTFQSKVLLLKIDNEQICSFENVSLEKQVVGFRSGENTVGVDDISIKNFNGNLLIHETFSYQKGYFELAFYNLFIIVLCFGFIFWLMKKKKIHLKKIIFIIWILQLISIIILVGYYCLDYYLISRLYATRYGRAISIVNSLEPKRHFIFNQFPFYNPYHNENIDPNVHHASHQKAMSFLALQKGILSTDLMIIQTKSEKLHIEELQSNSVEVKKYLQKNNISSYIKILFLGTSQTWGSGAHDLSERITVRVCNILQQQYNEREHFLIINASRPGSNSSQLLQRYKSHLFLFKPDIVVANLSNNDDRQSEVLQKNLTRLLEHNKNSNCKTLFILEANTIEKEFQLANNHELMARLAKIQQIPCINLHQHIKEHDDSGFLWWDFVHMTSYGQEVSAKFIAHEINTNFLQKK